MLPMDVALGLVSPFDERSRAPARSMSGASRRARLSVLVVDDDPTLGMLLAELVREFGHDAVVAANGAEAVAQVAARRPDLVLLDYEMPVMDGVTAARRIRGLPGCAELPLVMVSSRSDEAARSEAAAAGIRQYVSKPVSPATLGRLLDEVVAAGPPAGAP